MFGAALLTEVGCGVPPKALNLPPPVDVTTLGVGDVFELRLLGDDSKFPTSFSVAPDGTVDLPYVKRVMVTGLEPQQLSDLVRRKLIEGGIYNDPNVSVSIKEYNSKKVEVIGEVTHPGAIPLVSGMTLLRAITIAGGFTNLARKAEVTVRRHTKKGTEAASISVQSIIDNEIPDPPLQAGDSIYIPQRNF
jgi:protein involved in polysaccharide export with SLBB domain